MGDLLTSQLNIFLFSLLFGAIFGFVYDIFKTIRLILNLKKWYIAILDVLYFIFAAIGVFLFILLFDNGKIRSFVLLGYLFGCFTYKITVSKIIFRFIYKITNFLSKIIEKIVNLTTIFFSWICVKIPLGNKK